ncbi:MAG: NAD(P)H-hydrate dehydratase [Fusobacteriaceae bacterium]|nr:NAD(P)H-hydrate dehydratase [Fusobacteriaceae bacterium]
MKIITTEQMRNADKEATNRHNITGLFLMENAAVAVSKIIIKRLINTEERNILIFCGKGNNGGDGFAVGRLLFNAGFFPKIIFLGDIKDVSGDALVNLRRAKGINIINTSKFEEIEKHIKTSNIVIDAIFGTGIHGEIKEPFKTVIEKINAFSRYTISIDIPSGIDGDTGEILGTAIKADETITLALPKIGTMTSFGSEYSGKLHIADIGIPKAVIDKIDTNYNFLAKNDGKFLLPKRQIRSNKGTFGKVSVFAGNKNMAGAAYLACKSCYRIGAGLVYAIIPNKISQVLQNLIPEAIALTYDLDKNNSESFYFGENILNILNESKAIIIGPGLGQKENIKEKICDILRSSNSQIILDADGINNISDNKDILKQCKNIPIITPHIREMSRLTGQSISEILKTPINTAINFSKEYNCITLLKDYKTVIANPDGKVYINNSGSNALSKGGSGDVLSGIIGGLLSQKMDPFEASALGAYIHGLTGEFAQERYTNYSALAGELIDIIPDVLKFLIN